MVTSSLDDPPLSHPQNYIAQRKLSEKTHIQTPTVLIRSATRTGPDQEGLTPLLATSQGRLTLMFQQQDLQNFSLWLEGMTAFLD